MNKEELREAVFEIVSEIWDMTDRPTDEDADELITLIRPATLDEVKDKFTQMMDDHSYDGWDVIDILSEAIDNLRGERE